MWVRKRLDIRWSDLGSAVRDCLTRWDRISAAENLEDLWSAHGDAFVCLSVRTGFDLWLQALQLPKGSEVLVSAITIRDMVRIIEAHGLVPVPVDIDPDDLSVDLESLKRSITPQTRAILVAHLFGTRQPLEPILAIAREHGLFVAEDCAQAFAGRHFNGHPEADVSMFSFGSIKTATALGGALLCVRDAKLLARMREIHATYPLQQRATFAKKVLKYCAMKLMSYGPQFGALVNVTSLVGRDPDQFVAGLVRGFPGPQLLSLIRRQPCAPLLAVLHRRIAFYHRRSLMRRTASGQRLMELVGREIPCPGRQSQVHSFWVFPVLAENTDRLIQRLFATGFDASRAHSLFVVPPPESVPQSRAVMAEEMLPMIVQLPCYPEMPDHELRRLATEVRKVMRRSAVELARTHDVRQPIALTQKS